MDGLWFFYYILATTLASSRNKSSAFRRPAAESETTSPVPCARSVEKSCLRSPHFFFNALLCTRCRDSARVRKELFGYIRACSAGGRAGRRASVPRAKQRFTIGKPRGERRSRTFKAIMPKVKRGGIAPSGLFCFVSLLFFRFLYFFFSFFRLAVAPPQRPARRARESSRGDSDGGWRRRGKEFAGTRGYAG